MLFSCNAYTRIMITWAVTIFIFLQIALQTFKMIPRVTFLFWASDLTRSNEMIISPINSRSRYLDVIIRVEIFLLTRHYRAYRHQIFHFWQPSREYYFPSEFLYFHSITKKKWSPLIPFKNS